VHGFPNFSHWTPETFNSGAGRAEVWACVSGGQLGAAVETWRVALWLTVGVNVTGYSCFYGGGITKFYALRKYTGGITTFSNLCVGAGGYPNGLGLRINGSEVEVWGAYGDPLDPTSWTLICSSTDTTYRGRFYAGRGIEDPTAGGLGIGCFGAGIPRRTQFFRWLHN
jgi:hypothetical protein